MAGGVNSAIFWMVTMRLQRLVCWDQIPGGLVQLLGQIFSSRVVVAFEHPQVAVPGDGR